MNQQEGLTARRAGAFFALVGESQDGVLKWYLALLGLMKYNKDVLSLGGATAGQLLKGERARGVLT